MWMTLLGAGQLAGPGSRDGHAVPTLEPVPTMRTIKPTAATAPAGIQVYSLDSFCAAYHVSRSYAYMELKAGRLKASKAGDRTLIRVADAERWFASLPRVASAA